MAHETRPTNRLIDETSPYLRQHAHNPVDWYPWGEEALRKARELDRPIFLSIGYSACHWCHVMEHESFEDSEVGQILNDHFVSIKVDREERPDLDQIYMTAVQLLTQHGGWPMSVFLTPELKPFYGGTYFPPTDRHGLPSFRRLLHAIIDAWQNRRDEIRKQADDLTQHIAGFMQLEGDAGPLTEQLLRDALAQLRRAFDPRHGGFGRAPKFPHPMELRLLLRLWQRFGDEQALAMVTTSLDRMARGGLYDQLGGGFHRYSTDERWLVPHFEKMLYDNALLSVAYLEAFQATGNPFYREVVEETLGYVGREMTSPNGPFYSTQDADSEGVEGKFFVWSKREIEQLLGPDEARLFNDVYDVSEEGNWEETNIPHRARDDEQEAKLHNLPVEELRRRLADSKRKLFEARERRVKPGLDDKILTSWNALMIAAFAKAAQVLEEPLHERRAAAAAHYLLHQMRSTEGRLYRTASAARDLPRLNAYLEDYAYLIDALVTLYETNFDLSWLNAAQSLTRVMIDEFWDDEAGDFFFTGKGHERLITRGKDLHDNATPSGNSMAVTAFLRLGKLTGDQELLDKAAQTLSLFHDTMASTPTAAGQMLLALDFHLGPTAEVVVLGEKDNAEVQAALRLLRGSFRPRQVLAWWPDGQPSAEAVKLLPLLAGRAAKGAVTTYVCQNYTCAAPVVGAQALAEELNTAASDQS